MHRQYDIYIREAHTDTATYILHQHHIYNIEEVNTDITAFTEVT